MTQKFSEARRAAFLRALAETGNHTLSARRAKVSRSWVTMHKTEDPAFRAACEAAVAAAKLRLADAAETAPPAGWGTSGGAELVVRGSRGRRVQIAAARLKQWDPAAEQAFLSALAGSCNVKAAVEQGYLNIEATLLQNACAMLQGVELPVASPIPPMTVADALQLLHMHKREVRDIGARPGRAPRRRTMEEMRPRILAKVNMVRRAYGMPEID